MLTPYGVQVMSVTPVLAGSDAQIPVAFGRKDHGNRVHLVGERLPHDLDVEVVAFVELVDAREHERVDHAAMSGEHGMGVLAADRKRRAVQVAGPAGVIYDSEAATNATTPLTEIMPHATGLRRRGTSSAAKPTALPDGRPSQHRS